MKLTLRELRDILTALAEAERDRLSFIEVYAKPYEPGRYIDERLVRAEKKKLARYAALRAKVAAEVRGRTSNKENTR